MAGVCFGHQLIAQALGGTVRKSEKGWGIGRHVYDIAPGNGVIDGETIAIAASHQDQVIAPPAGGDNGFPFGIHPARRTALCQRHGAVGAAASRIHVPFAHFCCEKSRPKQRPRSVGRTAKASLEQPLDSADLGARSRAFWQGRAQCDPFRAGHQRLSVAHEVTDRRGANYQAGQLPHKQTALETSIDLHPIVVREEQNLSSGLGATRAVPAKFERKRDGFG